MHVKLVNIIIIDDPSRLILGSGKVKQRERERMWGTFFHSRTSIKSGKTLLQLKPLEQKLPFLLTHKNGD